MEDPLLAGEVLMDAVAELVGEGRHIAATIGPVEHHIRVDRRDRRSAECASALVGAGRHVDPVPVEEHLGDLAHPRRYRLEGLENDPAPLLPADGLVVGAYDGHPVVIGEAVDPEQLRLGPVPAAGQLGATLDRVDQGLHGLIGCLVGKVPGCEPVRVGAQPVHRRLLLEQRVEGVGPGPDSGLERLGHRLRDRSTSLAIGVEQPGEGLVEGDGFVRVRKLYPDGRGELVEEPVPGAAAGQGELGDDPFLRRAQ